ncbi:hypothetical protein CDL15_Pgr021574 [Punica granatum]|uniref:Piwi domain-containing protein n=1 Tax=Punica granatum TaxID=22663 RepID=A0A218WSQ5_PUNGR|nr:hypothetical protein CDL15_Pgr021574 [Punica granatum]
MDKGGSPDKAEANPILPVTSPNAASTVEFEGSNPPKFSIINRSGTGTSGKRVALLANHFKANINVPDAVFYQYNVTILQDNKKVEGKGISRKIIDRLYRTYHSELANRSFAYDGEGILYTGGQLPQNRFEFTVVLEESFVGRGSGDGESPGSPIKRSRQSFQSKTFSVEISYAASIPLKSIALVLRGAAAEHDSFDPLRVLAVVLRQEAANSFQMKPRNSNGVGDGQTIEITVSEYFSQHLGIELESSLYLPCLDVGKSKRPIYLPMEAVKNCRYNEDPVLVDCGISIAKHMTKVEGRVLETPKLKVGNNNECIPQNGRWNFNQKTFIRPIKVDRWVIVNFSARCDTSRLSRDLIDCGRTKGMQIECPVALIEEDPQQRREGPVARVEKMFELIRMKLSRPPKFILCALPERKISDIYGPWKKKCLTEFGIVTQCISPLKINDQYLTNVLLKINSKLGGINSLLAIEHASCIPKITDTPTMILGMDVSHGSPGRSDMPSISASPKLEIIDALYKPLANGEDDGIMRELLLDFYESSKGRKPTQIIVFRDGVSETQFNQVLDIELQQIVKAYNHLGETSVPKFTVIVAQKNHHTKLFQANASENVSPVAPIYYAHLAARQMGQFVKFEDLSETSSGGPIPELPRLHEEVESSMFFC